jgi:hypothetical protein
MQPVRRPILPLPISLLPGLGIADERKELSKMLLTFSEPPIHSYSDDMYSDNSESGELDPQGNTN